MNFNKIFNIWRNKKQKKVILFEYDSLIKTDSTINIPEGRLDKKIYLVQNQGTSKWVIFDCPGGHGRRIEINLMKSHRPNWTAQINKNRITLYPSVASKDIICNCHFWLENNIVYKAYYDDDYYD